MFDEILKTSNRDIQIFEGQIAITDPCYFFSNDDKVAQDLWMEFVHRMYNNAVSECPSDSGTLWIGDTMFLYSHTAYGDGSYQVITDKSFNKSFGGEFPVDAGMFCVVSVDSVRQNRYLHNWGLEGAVIIDLKKPTTFRMDGDGRMFSGAGNHMWVDTVDEFRDEFGEECYP